MGLVRWSTPDFGSQQVLPDFASSPRGFHSVKYSEADLSSPTPPTGRGGQPPPIPGERPDQTRKQKRLLSGMRSHPSIRARVAAVAACSTMLHREVCECRNRHELAQRGAEGGARKCMPTAAETTCLSSSSPPERLPNCQKSEKAQFLFASFRSSQPASPPSRAHTAGPLQAHLRRASPPSRVAGPLWRCGCRLDSGIGLIPAKRTGAHTKRGAARRLTANTLTAGTSEQTQPRATGDERRVWEVR